MRMKCTTWALAAAAGLAGVAQARADIAPIESDVTRVVEGPDPAASLSLQVASREREQRPLGGQVGGVRGEKPAEVKQVSGTRVATDESREPASGSLMSWTNVSGMALPLGVVLAVMIGCVVLMKKVMSAGSSLASALGPGGRSPAGLVEVLGRYPVAKGQLLVLIKLDRRVLLLGHSSPSRGSGTGGGFVTLAEVTDPEEVAAVLQKAEQTGPGSGLAAKFNAILRGKSEIEEGDGVTDLRRTRGTALALVQDEIDEQSDSPRTVNDAVQEPSDSRHVEAKQGTGAAIGVRAVARDEEPSAAGLRELKRRLASLQGRAAGDVA